jgi:nitric oxide reductase NorD protein
VTVPAPAPEILGRFRLLASFIAGRSIEIAEAKAGEPAHTNGQAIFVTSGSFEEQRREMLLQSALLGAGSLDRRLVTALRARPTVTRRYLALEGRRVLAELATAIPLAATLGRDGEPRTATADESLELARGRRKVDAPPEWFGAIRPARLLAPSLTLGGVTGGENVRLQFDRSVGLDDDAGDEEPSAKSKILKLFEAPLVSSQAIANFLRTLFGTSPSPADGPAGGEMPICSTRRVRQVGANARPLPTRIRFTGDDKPGAAFGVGGALYPEWDVHNNRYRPRWCRVIDFPLTGDAGVSDAGVADDDVLRRRLSRVGLGPKILRGRPDGDELDIEALIDVVVDLRSGGIPPENVYTERRKLARNLGVLILLDASGSATDTDTDGRTVHDRQRRAAATLAATLEELGDRVAVYGFRSHGRHAVHLPAIKTFEQRFGAIGRARLNQLQPSGYTRLGAGIRAAGEILISQAGTPNRLLVVLSDGFPYDHGYEGRYAEADSYKALEELRADGVACLCLSIGTAASTAELERVFGSAGHACAPTLADLSPRMDELFLSSLREFAAPKPSRG